MKKAGFYHKAQHPLLIAAGFAPVFVLLVAGISPDWIRLLPFFGMAYVAMAWLCIPLPGGWRIPCAAVESLLLFSGSLLMLPGKTDWLLLLVLAGYAVLLFAALPVGGWPAERELPPFFGVAGIVLHLLAQLFSDAARGYLLLSFLIFATLLLLSLNRSSLKSAAQSRVKVPLHMRRQNTLLTLGLLGISTALAALPAIGAFLRRIWTGLVQAVKNISAFLSSLLASQEAASGGGGGEAFLAMPGAEEAVEPGLFQKVVEVIIGIAAVLALAALLIWIGRKLLRKLRKLLDWFWQNLNRFSGAASRDYVDEITDTRDDAQYQRTGFLKRIQRRLSHVDEQKLPPAQRLRYNYLRLLIKHNEWTDASTARENLPVDMAQLYEKARYSGSVVTHEEAERFCQGTQRI